eukprot:4020306-Karenia_brevis.AAC.1
MPRASDHPSSGRSAEGEDALREDVPQATLSYSCMVRFIPARNISLKADQALREVLQNVLQDSPFEYQ